MNGQPNQTAIALTPRKTVKVLLGIMAFLFVARIGTAAWHYQLGHMDRFGIMRQFNTNYEANAPTYFSHLILLFAAALLALIAASKKREQDRFTGHWTALSLVFLCMSIDEACRVHEFWTEHVCFLHGRLGLIGNVSWVLVGGAVAVIVALAFPRFLLSLPRRWRITFVAAGFLFLICGAIGGEVFGALSAALGKQHRLGYAVASTFEEFSEMGGVVIFIWGLLTYIEAQGMSILVGASHPVEHLDEVPRLEIAMR